MHSLPAIHSCLSDACASFSGLFLSNECNAQFLHSNEAALLDIAVHKNWESHIDASHSRQPLVKGERLVRYEVNAVIFEVSLSFRCFVLLTVVLLV